MKDNKKEEEKIIKVLNELYTRKFDTKHKNELEDFIVHITDDNKLLKSQILELEEYKFKYNGLS